ncbi:hypothetical protein AB205_0097710, partial [Aquarana catesbeiana]
DNIRRYENKAGTFITGIDVTSKEAIEKKEQRAKRFHFRAEVSDNQRNVVLDRDMMRKALPKVRLETLHVVGVDDLSTEDIFTFFKQYPPGYIEWLDDTSCNVVWLDEVTAARALLNLTTMPVDTKDKKDEESTSTKSKADRFNDSSGDETEEGEVDEDNPSDAEETNKNTLNTEKGERVPVFDRYPVPTSVGPCRGEVRQKSGLLPPAVRPVGERSVHVQ